MAAAYSVENGASARAVVWLADGALGNWNLASVIAPRALQILDWTHAVNGMKCGKALLGEADPGPPTVAAAIDVTAAWARRHGAALE